jgi:hypothetical protein
LKLVQIMKNLIYVLITLFIVSVSCKSKEGQWENLIKKDLSNWEQLNGSAKYELKNGEIIGTTVIKSPNSFLCSKAKFGDFILEFDTWVDPQMNSGVQLRSESKTEYQNGRVHGYQVELDPSERAWSGGIYDEGRRGWLYTLDKNSEGQKAFKNNQWNHFRIEAKGNSIRTWVNGIPCADLVDDMTPSGFIALQVHSIGKDSTKIGEQVKWKNIRIITKEIDKYLTPYTPVIPQYSFLNNTLTEREIKEGWKLLWDGKTSNGWRGAKLTTFPASGWVIQDGTITTGETGGKESVAAGDIVTVDKFKNFELIVDFNYSPKANSGIKYLVNTELNKGPGSAIGYEYQIIDDKQNADVLKGIESNRTMAALYDLIAPLPKRDNGAGQWNRATIIVNGKHIEHWLNGQKTIDLDRGTDSWRAIVEESKFKKWPTFAEAAEGNILLQEHGNAVSFKNIKIREIK